MTQWAVRTYVARTSDVRQPRAFYEADSLSTEIYDALAASIKRPDRQPGVHQLAPSAPLHLSAALLGTFVLASCGAVASIVDPVPCWQERIEFNVRPVTVEGILQVDEEASGMFIRLSDGREYDIGFPDGFRVIIGPGVGGHVDSPHGGTIAEAGDSISFWGGDTHVGEEPRPPAPPGRRGLIVCAINGQQVRDANGATIGQ